MAVRTCTCSMHAGPKVYSAHVEAESAFEAALLALKAFSENGYSLSSRSGAVEITVRDLLGTNVSVEKAWAWLARQGKTPKEQAKKAKLRGILREPG